MDAIKLLDTSYESKLENMTLDELEVEHSNVLSEFACLSNIKRKIIVNKDVDSYKAILKDILPAYLDVVSKYYALVIKYNLEKSLHKVNYSNSE
jgi:hypothetical protein